MAVEIEILGAGDGELLANVAPDVFDYGVDRDLASEFLRDDRHHLAVALDGDRVVGFASAVHYVHPDKPPELWVNEVVVASTYRGRGLGKRLLRSLFDLAASLGCREAWVLTDRENEPAMRLYASLSGSPSTHVMFSFRLSD